MNWGRLIEALSAATLYAVIADALLSIAISAEWRALERAAYLPAALAACGALSSFVLAGLVALAPLPQPSEHYRWC